MDVLPKIVYASDTRIQDIDNTLERWDQSYGVDLNPDFQRGHVWSLEQQQNFVSNFLRGFFPHQGVIIQFNSPSFLLNRKPICDGLDPSKILIVDGLQRLTALRRFVAGEITTREGVSHEMLEKYEVPVAETHVRMVILRIPSREKLLKYYLDINNAGTPHTKDELDRVRSMIAHTARSSEDLAPHA
jgi:hypothetical protein